MLWNRIVFLASAFLVKITNGASLNTSKHQEEVMTLRNLMKAELPEAFMLKDYWLENWLKSNKFDVENAKRDIEQHLETRSDRNTAQILTEDWSEMRARFPYSLNTTDKSGRPVIYMDFGQWNIASFLTTPEAADNFLRYFVMIGRDSESHVLQLRAKGRDVTQASGILNVGTQVYADLTDLIKGFVSAHMKRVVFVNVPNHFKQIYFFLNKDTRKMLQLHGQDQEQLEDMLVEYIDRDQIPKGILNEIVVKDNSEGSMVWDKEL